MSDANKHIPRDRRASKPQTACDTRKYIHEVNPPGTKIAKRTSVKKRRSTYSTKRVSV